MYLADIKSRAYLQGSCNPKWQSEFCMQLEKVNNSEERSMEDAKLDDIRRETSQDDELECYVPLQEWLARMQARRPRESATILQCLP